MIINCFFDIHGNVYINWVLKGQTSVNQYYYLEVLMTLREQVRKKLPETHETFFDQWKIHMGRCRDYEGLNIEGDMVNDFIIKNKSLFITNPVFSHTLYYFCNLSI